MLLANISLLAHAVIPHHHHDREAVAIVDMAAATEQAHHQHSHGSHHSHDHGHAHEENLQLTAYNDDFEVVAEVTPFAVLQPPA